MRKRTFLSSVVLYTLAVASPALAQTSPDATAPASPSPSDSAGTSSAPSTDGSSLGSSGSARSMSASDGSSDTTSDRLKQRENGVVVSLGLTSRMPVVQVDGTTSAAANGIGGSLMAGYKLNRIIVGLGFSIDHFGQKTKLVAPSGTATSVTDTTSFLISPTVQVGILRAAAGRLELYGSAQFGLGRAFLSRSNDPTLPSDVLATYDNKNFHLNYEVGPGLRFYFIPQFALQLTSGVAGDHFFASQDNPSGRRTDSLSSVSLFGNLGLLGVF